MCFSVWEGVQTLWMRCLLPWNWNTTVRVAMTCFSWLLERHATLTIWLFVSIHWSKLCRTRELSSFHRKMAHIGWRGCMWRRHSSFSRWIQRIFNFLVDVLAAGSIFSAVSEFIIDVVQWLWVIYVFSGGNPDQFLVLSLVLRSLYASKASLIRRAFRLDTRINMG